MHAQERILLGSGIPAERQSVFHEAKASAKGLHALEDPQHVQHLMVLGTELPLKEGRSTALRAPCRLDDPDLEDQGGLGSPGPGGS